MGARQSKRSVDITTTPKKGDGEIVVEGEGKMERIAEVDAKQVTTNGTLHTEIEYADKDESTKEDAEKGDIKENGVSESEEGKTPDKEVPASGDQLNESALTEKSSEIEGKIEETPESKKSKEKSKKKKWSFRSMSFTKKDKSKPSKDADKNGDVKEVTEETAEENATSPAVETPKSEVPTSPEAVDVTTNGDAAAGELAKPLEELTKVVEETVEAVEEVVSKVEEPKAPEPVKETLPAESAPSPVKEDVKAPVEESAPKTSEEPKPVVESSPVKEEIKEVRTEEVPPPLPSSNPPSPVTVFAESTKADALPPLDQVPQQVVPIIETVAEQSVVIVPSQETAPVVESKVPSSPPPPPKVDDECPSPPPVLPPPELPSLVDVCRTPVDPSQAAAELVEILHPVTEPPQSVDDTPLSEPVVNADSLPDISTESLPSLPEPVSECLPEPMSLPPVESVPESIAHDASPLSPPPRSESPVAPESPKPTETILTNGNTNGLPSPVEPDVTLPPNEGSLKQVPVEIPESKNDVDSPNKVETKAADTPAAVEE